MLWKTLKLKGDLNGHCAKEINFVFDNCTGQNKNRMVTRLLFFMVKLSLCKVARAIFLVKGHTKNDCDRMFNFMKMRYRKVNCYSPVDLIALVNEHPQVNAIVMDPTDFNDWDSLENKLVSKAEGILKNHVFSVDCIDSNVMLLQEFVGSLILCEELVLKPFCTVDWTSFFSLKTLKAPGFPDIKWTKLYAKWGHFIPEENKKDLKYYSMAPPESVKRKIAEQTTAARKAREKRTRGGGHDATSAPTKQKAMAERIGPNSNLPKMSGEL